jgi:hypothetical protein
MTLHVGVARADITPAAGIPMVGFAGRSPAVDVHDSLAATALAIAEGERPVLLFHLDLLFLQASTVAAFRQVISSATDVAAADITLACTHNHYGPAVDPEQGAIVAAYLDNLAHLLAGAGRQACDRLQPAHIGLAWGTSDIGINRRELRDGQIVLGNNPDGPVDRHVGVARVDAPDGRPLATLLSFACHPVSQRGQMASISADFPGRACRVVEDLNGAPCLYLQGACGDVNPIRMEDDFEPARSLGVRLGCEAARLWEVAAPEPASGLASTSQTIDLPGYRYGSEEEAAELTEALRRDVERRRQQGDTSGSTWWAQHRLERVEGALGSWRTGTPLAPIEAEVQALRLGPLSLATAPGEIFTENGEHVKAGSPFEHTFFLGYTNGSIGYVPTRSAYPEGGYEVTHACRVDPQAGEMINDGCLALLGELHT